MQESNSSVLETLALDESTASNKRINSFLSFEDAIKHLAYKDSDYDRNKVIRNVEHVDLSKYMFLLNQTNETMFSQAIKSLSKSQIEEILFDLPRLLEVFSETRITPLFRYRYRRYMFSILYLLWQDYYDKPKFHNLFLYVLNHPKSQKYLPEINFTLEQLRSLVLARQIENKLIELARAENLDMREFFLKHQISRDSVIAMDAMGIFFLFCSGNDYLEIGSERLIIAIMRSEMKNQAKILSNMIRKLSKEELKELQDVIQYFNYKYNSHINGVVQEFWDLISNDIKDDFQNILIFIQEDQF